MTSTEHVVLVTHAVFAALAALSVAGIALPGPAERGNRLHRAVIVAVAVTVSLGSQVAARGFALDEELLAGLALACPVVVGLHFGPRLGVATAAARWAFVLLARYRCIFDVAPERTLDTLPILFVTLGAAMLSGLLAGLGARRSPGLGRCALLLGAVPALVHPGAVWADPNVWLAWASSVGWMVLGDVTLRSCAWRADANRWFAPTRYPGGHGQGT